MNGKFQAIDIRFFSKLKARRRCSSSSKSTGDGKTVESDTATIDGNIDGRAEVRPETKAFCHISDRYIRCKNQLDSTFSESTELQRLATDPMEVRFGNPVECQQQSCAGTTVQTLDELYIAAEISELFFKKIVKRVLANMEQFHVPRVYFPTLKGRKRAQEKAEEDYYYRNQGPAISWVKDIVRTSIVFRSSDEILYFITKLQEDPATRIVNVKNRFRKPSITGYRDILLHCEIDTDIGFQHICELQIHHAIMKDMDKKLNPCQYYEYFRPFFATSSNNTWASHLGLISRGLANDNDSILTELFSQKFEIEYLSGLGELFERRLMKYDWALYAYQQVYEVQLVTFGPTCLETIDTLNHLGRVLYKQGDLENAACRFNKAFEKIHLPGSVSDPHLGDIYFGLGNIFKEQGKEKDSLDAYSKSLAIKINILGEHHLSLATLYYNMATGKKQGGELDEALELYQECLGIYGKTLGLDNCNVADVHSSMAGILSTQGKLKESLRLYQKAVDIYKDHEGCRMVEAYEHMAVLLQRQNQRERSIDMYLRALDARIVILGGVNLEVASSYDKMAKLYSRHGKLEEAVEMHIKVLEICKQIHGEDHISVGDVCFKIAGVLYRQRKYSCALHVLETSKRIYGNGDDCPKAARTKRIMEAIRKTMLDRNSSSFDSVL